MRAVLLTSTESSMYVLYTSLRLQTKSRLADIEQSDPSDIGSKAKPAEGTRRGPEARTDWVFRLHTTSVGSGSPESAANCSPEREKASAVHSSGGVSSGLSSVESSRAMRWSMSG